MQEQIARTRLDLIGVLQRFMAETQRMPHRKRGAYPLIAQSLLDIVKDLEGLVAEGAQPAAPTPRAVMQRQLDDGMSAALHGVALVLGAKAAEAVPAVRVVGATFDVLARALCDVHARVAALEVQCGSVNGER